MTSTYEIISLADFWTHMDLERPIDTLRVQQHDDRRGGMDAGLASGFWFCEDRPGRVGEMLIGEMQGSSHERGAYNWWPVYLDGEQVAELRDDASGCTLHVRVT